MASRSVGMRGVRMRLRSCAATVRDLSTSILSPASLLRCLAARAEVVQQVQKFGTPGAGGEWD